ncbi:putative restriction endonuclease [Catenulispora sp. EB89]|uniref:HNH endonuclease n=1 Tax=Catenulispora sp. EB89 TaxID=3156257 RepID=UPI003512C19D
MARVSVRSEDYDRRFREAAFAWLAERGDSPVVAREELAEFVFEGERIPLVDPSRGIRRPAVLRGALSIMTTYSPNEASAPYEDLFGTDGFLRYKYRGTDAMQGDNRAVREAMASRLPMIWLYGVATSTYLAIFPVYAISEERGQNQFVVSVDVPSDLSEASADSVIERKYRIVHTNQRVHQPVFRARVMRAYEQRCAMCSLRHVRLLDAAHIRRDAHPRGIAAVSNGMALCKIHHAAYDQNILGIHPDLVVHVRPDILEEVDGPMLLHGLQEMAGVQLQVPRRQVEKPSRDAVEERYAEFLCAAP